MTQGTLPRGMTAGEWVQQQLDREFPNKIMSDPEEIIYFLRRQMELLLDAPLPYGVREALDQANKKKSN